MTKQKLPKEELNQSALSIEEAESEIKIIVKNAYITREPQAETLKRVRKVIGVALNQIPIESFRATVERSLIGFYWKCDRIMRGLRTENLKLLLAVRTVTNADKLQGETRTPLQQAKTTLASGGIPQDKITAINLGNAAQTYMKEYMRNVREVFERLSQEVATDPNAHRRTSLRNLAEMETRFAKREQDKQRLLADNVKLVIISSHADCSDRCRQFQGKVFSLDGTSGTTTDGRHYVPLEAATNIQAKSKSGKVYPYFNGLFGFNCRHYMVAYKDGYKFQQIPAKVEQREYAITEKQREYEREVRKWRAKAEAFQGIDQVRFSQARKKAIWWNKQYIKFSQDNNRPYYPSRTRLL